MALLTLSQTARALTVTVDGEILPGESFAEDGVTYVPLAPLLEALGDGVGRRSARRLGGDGTVLSDRTGPAQPCAGRRISL